MRRYAISFSQKSLLFAILASAVLFVRPVAAEDFDWRGIGGQNWLTSVKDQFGGTCWDFAACGALEAKYMLTRNDTTYKPDISEQQINWETNPDMGNMVTGGNAYKVFDYALNHSIVLELECPVQGTDVGALPYWPLAAGWENRGFRATANFNTVCQGTSLAYVKNCLKLYGPMVIHLQADSDFYPDPGENRGGHQVVLVGYHDNLPGERLGGGYWIVKNSWGLGGYNSFCGPGYDAIDYDSQPSYEDWGIFAANRDVNAISGSVYYNGAMATVTWKGGSGTWSSGGNNWSGVDQYGTSLPTYAWENKESSATFNASAGTTITLNGTVIAHGLTISSGATGYVFNGTNSPSLTVTGAGINANESATVNAPVTVGAPQTWTVASGKSLTIGGDVHTIINALTITGSGDTTITGSINGGGALNSTGAAPGAITKSGAGTLHLTGAATYAVPLALSAGTLSFEQAAATVANYASAISGSGAVTKSNFGTIILSAANTYSGATSITRGAVQADSGAGLPSGSFLNLNGGVLQSNGTTTFIRNLGTSGGTFQFNTNGGGFSAGAGPMTVSIGSASSPTALTWGSAPADIGSKIVGILKLSSTTAGAVTTFQNAINVNGADRTIQVDDNVSTYNDYAVVSGKISGSGGITKTGDGLLFLANANDYTGTTKVSGGLLQANIGMGIPNAGFLCLDGGQWLTTATSFTRSLGSAGGTFQWTANGGGFGSTGGPMTINIGNQATPDTLTWGSTPGVNIMGPLKLGSAWAVNDITFQNSLNLAGGARTIEVGGNSASLPGVISDSVGGGSLTKTGQGSLTIGGDASNTYTGAIIVAGGTLVLAKTNGATAVSGSINLTTPADGTNSYLQLGGDNQFASTSVLNFSGTGSGSACFKLLGHQTTVGGLVASVAGGLVENTQTETGIADVTLTINGPSNYEYAGAIRDTATGSGHLALVKDGAGTQTFTGTGAGGFTGGLTVNNGTLNYSGGALPSGNITINGGTLSTSAGAQPIGAFQITGGLVSGSGTLTSSAAYDIQAGTVSAALAGSRILNKTTDGAAVVNAMTSGGLTISAGTLSFVGYLPGGAYTISGGTLDIGSATKRIGQFRITGGTVDGTGTLNGGAPYDIQAGTVNAVLGAGVGLTKTTAGVATVKSPTYSGVTNVQAGTLTFLGALPGGNYVISGGALNIGSLSRSIGTFQITGGTVSGAGTLTSSAAYNVQAGTLDATLAGGTSIGLDKTGSATAVLTGANTYAGRTTVASGILDLGPAAQNAVFSLGGADIQAGRLDFDYNGALSPAATIQSLLSSSRHGGLWDIGQFRSSTAAGAGLTLGWFDDGSSKVTVMATYAGDFNLDGVVTNLDLDTWKANFGSGTAWQMGDANYDGAVNGLDLDMWKANVGLPPIVGGSSVVGVPEPSTLALLAAALLGLLAYAKRRRIAGG